LIFVADEKMSGLFRRGIVTGEDEQIATKKKKNIRISKNKSSPLSNW
jgi:hypothetical protein